MLGTYEYMSPEQKRGEEATGQSDLYAVGLMAYRLLTGRGLSMKTPSQIDSSLDPSWDVLLESALEETPSERWVSAGEMNSRVPGESQKVHGKHAEAVTAKDQAPDTDGSAADHLPPVAGDGPAWGHAWTSPATGMEFIWIQDLEIWVGRFEVTNAEYRRMHPNHDSGSFEKHSLNEDRQPVTQVNFQDAEAYAAWLTRQDADVLGGARYRLPSEPEWETYARCGDNRTYPWGEEWPPPAGCAGNYHGEEGAGTWGKIKGYDDGLPVAAPVDDVWANPWGLRGVGGNVWEVCACDSTGQSHGAWRGASWGNFSPLHLQVSCRIVVVGSCHDAFNGFRLVLAPR